MNTSSKALSLYRQILRTGKNWKGSETEREYIFEEAHKLFRKNKNETNQKEIEALIFEGQTRMELAIHYKIPYPRLSNYLMGESEISSQQSHARAIPAYLHS